MSLSKRVRFEVFKRDNFTCQYCGAKPPDTVLEVDHAHPRCEGGTDEMANLKTACWNCNRGKGRTPIQPVFSYRTVGGGPLDKQEVILSRYYEYPLLWVVTDDTGVIMTYEDEWITGDDPTKNPRLGHPGYQVGQVTSDPEWFMRSYRAEERPRVIGAYSAQVREMAEDNICIALEWLDTDRLILELTA